jgi:hypothetical protein
MVEFMQQGTTITSEVHCETLKHCVEPLRKKAWNADTRCNARPHTAARTRALLEHLN